MLFTALLIAGCSSSAPASPKSTPETSKPTEAPKSTEAPKPNLPPLENNWTVKMVQSGGIMGLLRSIEISSDGKYTVIDELANKTVTGELSADETSRLKEQVASASFTAKGTKGAVCADCFVYDLEALRNGERFVAQLNDISLAGSELATLVRYLQGLIATALK
jgi:PBP1b-binding outer membrane lipoprotein LpoB